MARLRTLVTGRVHSQLKASCAYVVLISESHLVRAPVSGKGKMARRSQTATKPGDPKVYKGRPRMTNLLLDLDGATVIDEVTDLRARASETLMPVAASTM